MKRTPALLGCALAIALLAASCKKETAANLQEPTAQTSSATAATAATATTGIGARSEGGSYTIDRDGVMVFATDDDYMAYWKNIEVQGPDRTLAEQATRGFVSYESLYRSALKDFETLGNTDSTEEGFNNFVSAHAKVMAITREDFNPLVFGSFSLVTNADQIFQIADKLYYVDSTRIISLPKSRQAELPMAIRGNLDGAKYARIYTTAQKGTGLPPFAAAFPGSNSAGRYPNSKHRGYVNILASWWALPSSSYSSTYEYRQFSANLKAQKKGWTGIWYANPLTFYFDLNVTSNWASATHITGASKYTSNYTYYYAGWSWLQPGILGTYDPNYYYSINSMATRPQGEIDMKGHVDNFTSGCAFGY